MQRFIITSSKPKSCLKILSNHTRSIKQLYPDLVINNPRPNCHVFINHRGADTKGNISGLLHDRLSRIGVNAFLDKKSMGPGDKLSHEIETAILDCRVAVAVISPRYGESYYCLHELARIIECNKRLVPIFWNVQPSEVVKIIKTPEKYSSSELKRFTWALEEVRQTVGITFDPVKGDWSELLYRVTDAVMKNIKDNPQIVLSNKTNIN